jgi:hypothetical protein
MSKSSYEKRAGGNVITKKMLKERMDNLATLTTAMETTLMEWEIWYRLIASQKKFLSQPQWEAFVSDGPIFTEFTGKIMASIRENIPELVKDESADVPVKPGILDSTGNVTSTETKKIIV